MSDFRRVRAAWCATLAGALLATCIASMAAAPAAAPAEPAAVPTAPAQNAARTPRPPNYVDAARFDYITLLPPAPQKDSARYEADRRMFLQTRRFKDTPRWVMATSDAEARPANFLKDFSCALDVEATPANAPAIAKLAQNLSSDAGA